MKIPWFRCIIKGMKKVENRENNFINGKGISAQDAICQKDKDSAGGNIIVDLDVLIPVIREQLAAGQTVRFTPTGVSMEPMLRHGIDNVVLSPVPQVLKRYDLPLYQRENGQYVLHRVVEVQPDICAPEAGRDESTTSTYTCMGDNQFVKESGLRHEQMIGLVTEFYRDGRRHSVDETGYRIYCRVWYRSRRLRHFWKRAVRKLRRMLG